jgi:hypothetical protein
MKHTCVPLKRSQPNTKIAYKNQNKSQRGQLVMAFVTSGMGGQTSHNGFSKCYFNFYII